MTPTHPFSRERAARRAWRLVPAAVLAVALAAPAVAASPVPTGAPGSPMPGASSDICFLRAPVPGASPSASPDPSASPLPVRKGTIPAAGGILEPGAMYSDYSLGPTLAFTAGDCWAATPGDAGYGLALVWGGSPAAAVLTFTEFEGLVFEDPCQATSDKVISIDRTPEALATDLMANPSLITGQPTDVQVAGFSGLRLALATQQPMRATDDLDLGIHPVRWVRARGWRTGHVRAAPGGRADARDLLGGLPGRRFRTLLRRRGTDHLDAHDRHLDRPRHPVSRADPGPDPFRQPRAVRIPRPGRMSRPGTRCGRRGHFPP